MQDEDGGRPPSVKIELRLESTLVVPPHTMSARN